MSVSHPTHSEERTPRGDSPGRSGESTTLAGAPDSKQLTQQLEPGSLTPAAAPHGKHQHENVLLDTEKGLVPGHAADEYPDGGLRAWSVVLGAWCVSFTTWGITNSYGVFQTHYQANQLANKTSSDITWIGSFQLCMVLACSTLSGAAFDAGYLKYLLCGGTVLYTAGLFGLSFGESYAEIFLAQGVACGVASGIVFLPAVSSVSHFFKRRRATALGILATGSSIGGVVYPILLNRTFNSIGFGWGVRAAGFLTTGLLCIACVGVKTRLPKRRGTFFQFSAYRDWAFSLYVLGAGFVILGLYTPFYFIESAAISYGIDPNLAFYSLSILNAASLFGRVIPNYLADTYGPLTILLPNCVLSGVLIFVWLPLTHSVGGMVVFSLLFGFTSGAYVSTMPACVAVLTEDMTQIGVRISMAFLGIAPFALVGSPIAGAIIASQGGSYQGAAIFGGVVVLVGSAIVAAGRQVMVRRKQTQWV